MHLLWLHLQLHELYSQACSVERLGIMQHALSCEVNIASSAI